MRSQRSISPLQNRWFRILGVAFVMYVFSYMDRTNISMAIPSMRADLGMSTAAIGIATGTLGAARAGGDGGAVTQIPSLREAKRRSNTGPRDVRYAGIAKQ